MPFDDVLYDHILYDHIFYEFILHNLINFHVKSNLEHSHVKFNDGYYFYPNHQPSVRSHLLARPLSQSAMEETENGVDYGEKPDEEQAEEESQEVEQRSKSPRPEDFVDPDEEEEYKAGGSAYRYVGPHHARLVASHHARLVVSHISSSGMWFNFSHWKTRAKPTSRPVKPTSRSAKPESSEEAEREFAQDKEEAYTAEASVY